MALFDHLVGNRHNNVWHFNTQSLGCAFLNERIGIF
jgi:hypothetical protein